MKKSPKDIYTELGISRSSFYKAYSELIQEGVIEGDEPDLQKLIIKRPVSNHNESKTLDDDSKTLDNESKILDSDSKTLDDESKILDSDSKTLDNDSKTLDDESSNPAQNGSSDDSPDFSPDSSPDYYSDFSPDSLSDSEKERERDKNENLKFFNLQDEITRQAILEVGYRYFLAQLPEYPALPEKWIKCNAITISQHDLFVLEYNKLKQAKSSADFSRGKTEA